MKVTVYLLNVEGRRESFQFVTTNTSDRLSAKCGVALKLAKEGMYITDADRWIPAHRILAVDFACDVCLAPLSKCTCEL